MYLPTGKLNAETDQNHKSPRLQSIIALGDTRTAIVPWLRADLIFFVLRSAYSQPQAHVLEEWNPTR